VHNYNRSPIKGLNEAAWIARGKQLLFAYETESTSTIEIFKLIANLAVDKIIVGASASDIAESIGLKISTEAAGQEFYDVGFHIALPRDAFVDIGGFEETLDNGSAVVFVDAALKAYQLGYSIHVSSSIRRSVFSYSISAAVMSNLFARWGKLIGSSQTSA